MRIYLGTTSQYNKWKSNAETLIREHKSPGLMLPAAVLNSGIEKQCYWEYVPIFETDALLVEDPEEITAVLYAFSDEIDAVLEVLKIRKKKELDTYSDSDAVITWFYEFNNVSHKQMLSDKDVSDIVTTAMIDVGGTLWSFYDNTSAYMTTDDLVAFSRSAKARDEFLWSHYGKLRNKINACTTVEEIRSIDITAGWGN